MLLFALNNTVSLYNTPGVVHSLYPKSYLITLEQSIPSNVSKDAIFFHPDYRHFRECKSYGLQTIYIAEGSFPNEFEFSSRCDKVYALTLDASLRLHVPKIAYGGISSLERITKTSPIHVIGYAGSSSDFITSIQSLIDPSTFTMMSLFHEVGIPNAKAKLLFEQQASLRIWAIMLVDDTTPELVIWQALFMGIPCVMKNSIHTLVPGPLVYRYESESELPTLLHKLCFRENVSSDFKSFYKTHHRFSISKLL